MTSTIKRKSMALVMALLLCFSMFVSFKMSQSYTKASGSSKSS